MGGGILVVIGGLIAVPGPGPGRVVTFLGLDLIAGEYVPVARLADRAEVELRAPTRRVAGIWTDSSTVTKVTITLAILLGLVALGYGACYLFFGGSNFVPKFW